MKKKVRMMVAIYKNICIPSSDARRVRGFFADLDSNDSLLHNHKATGEQIYQYPMVQYKVIREHPVIVAVENGIPSIHPHLMEQTTLRIGGQVYSDVALDIRLIERPLGDSREILQYRFCTPWIALNQENFAKYHQADEEEQNHILCRILIGNVLSLCKGFGVTIENPLQVTHQLKPIPVFYKGRKMDGFIGTFQINCCIPEMLGIGKGTARGFGTVKMINRKEE